MSQSNSRQKDLSALSAPPPRLSGLPLVNHLCGWWTFLVLVFLYLPIILLVAFSFNSSRLNILWEGFTFKWYVALMSDAPILGAARNSLLIAVIVSLSSLVLGTVAAWMLHRYRFPFGKLVDILVFIPMAIPEIIMGISLMIFFKQISLSLGYATVIIAHITFCFPFVMIAVQARLDGLDPFLEEAAMDLGANPLQAFWLVIVPYLMPALVSSLLMSFTLSMDEYIVTVFTNGPASITLPQKVFGLAKVGLNPMLNAISTLFILATFLFVVLGESLRRRETPSA